MSWKQNQMRQNVLTGLVWLVAIIQLCTVPAMTQTNKTIVHGQILHMVNGSPFPVKYSPVSIAPSLIPAQVTQSNTDGSGMYTFRVQPGNYTLTIQNLKGGRLQYTVIATAGKYSIVKPIVLP